MNGDRFFSQKSKKKRKGSRKKKNKGEGIERPFSVFLSPILICKTNLTFGTFPSVRLIEGVRLIEVCTVVLYFVEDFQVNFDRGLQLYSRISV